MTDTTPHVPDLPCPKCGHDDVHMKYCDGPGYPGLHAHPDDRCVWDLPEHFHRHCRRCSYQWRTDDVIKPVVKR